MRDSVMAIINTDSCCMGAWINENAGAGGGKRFRRILDSSAELPALALPLRYSCLCPSCLAG